MSGKKKHSRWTILPSKEEKGTKLEKKFQAHSPKEQAEVAIQISKKTDFQPKVIKKDKEVQHCIHLKGKIFAKINSTLWTSMFQKQGQSCL